MRAKAVAVRPGGISVRDRARTRMGTLAQLLGYLARGGRWWLLPMMIVLLGASVLLAVVTALEYVAPFVYTVL